jgi:superfamily II DNA or RNA helicase
LAVGIERAADHANFSDPVVVTTVQTMSRRLGQWTPKHFGLVVCDEAHHAISDTWLGVVNHFAGARVLGVTATPDRGDKRNLGEFFESIAAEIGLFDLVGDGFLAPIAVRTVPLRIDLSAVKSVAGDLSADECGAAIEPYLGQIAVAVRDLAPFRRVLAFLPLRATSRKFVDACSVVGLIAQHIDGESIDRAPILTAMAAGKYDVLSNAMLLTEGYDDPAIDCVVVLRPTRSRPLYAQMVGRGTRILDGKKDLLLLDFLWHHERHALARPASLIADTEEHAAEIEALAEEHATGGGEEMDLETMASDATARREERLRAEIERNAKRQGELISAKEFAVRHRRLAIAEYEPAMAWEREKISEKQAKILESEKIDLSTISGKGHASKILDVIFAERDAMPATSKQRWAMRSGGAPNWSTATRGDARQWFAGNRKVEA